MEPKTSEAKIVDFAALSATACPCGSARRAFALESAGAVSVHRVDIAADARAHFHERQTEIYYFLECGADARIELDGRQTPVRPGMSVLIPPGVRHRAVGRMTILNIVTPAFDPADEHFDE